MKKEMRNYKFFEVGSYNKYHKIQDNYTLFLIINCLISFYLFSRMYHNKILQTGGLNNASFFSFSFPTAYGSRGWKSVVTVLAGRWGPLMPLSLACRWLPTCCPFIQLSFCVQESLASVCVSYLLLQRYQLDWTRSHLKDLVFKLIPSLRILSSNTDTF